MLFNNKKNHPAASGRFASYEEIALNFSNIVYNFKPTGKDRTASEYKNFFYYASLSILALAVSIIITLLLSSNFSIFFGEAGRFWLTAAYLILWIPSLLVVLYIGNIIAEIKQADVQKEQNRLFVKNSGNDKPSINNSAEIFKNNKAFRLGILNNTAIKNKKKFPSLLVGLDEKKRFEHTLIISPTGGGKTSRYIVPGIAADAAYSNVSVFAIDIDAPFLYKSVKDYWINAGKKAFFFDPFDYSLNYSSGGSNIEKEKISFNLLQDRNKNPLPDEKLFDISSILFHLDKREIKGGDIQAHKYYSKRSSDLFYGGLLYLKYKYDKKYFDLPTVKAFFERGVKFIENEINGFKGENEKRIKNLFNNLFELPIYERAKIVTDILSNLDFLSDPKVSESFKCKENREKGGGNQCCFFMEDFFSEDALFIAGIPKEKINSGGDKLMSFITHIFINSIYENRRACIRTQKSENVDSVSHSRTSNDIGERSIFMYLDEFPALTLNDFDIELANLRKTNTGVCLTAQDIAFLKDSYEDASLITSNIGTHIVMGHAGYETCRFYSEISGERYVFHREKLRKNLDPLSLHADMRVDETQVASGLYPLISPDELKNMDRNSIFIYSKYVNPFILNLEHQ